MNEKTKHITKQLAMHGIDITRFDAKFIEKAFQKCFVETLCNSDEEYLQHLRMNDDEVKKFLSSLHIGYSEFFRNSLTFSVLERIILPSIVLQKKSSKRKEIRIWSAACAAGQEAYSLAMLLEELKKGNDEKISYRIFATDQNQLSVNKAENGKYPIESLNNLSMKRVKEWFTKHDDAYSIKPLLKENINFSRFDLFSHELSSPPESIFGDFDLVFCANLLFYYKPKYRDAILQKTNCSLANEGFLVVGEAERDILLKHGYFEVSPQSGVFNKRMEHQ
ncbi:MAG: hypothetical protein EHM93_10915 [Bacteroidales bacterium]|nr:MAG: hypothetical protein EHM93_10915 [Bacteroidales bacterium]